MTAPKPMIIELPRFADDVRASVPESDETFADFEVMLDSWIARFKKARAGARYEEGRPSPDMRATSPHASGRAPVAPASDDAQRRPSHRAISDSPLINAGLAQLAQGNSDR